MISDHQIEILNKLARYKRDYEQRKALTEEIERLKPSFSTDFDTWASTIALPKIESYRDKFRESGITTFADYISPTIAMESGETAGVLFHGKDTLSEEETGIFLRFMANQSAASIDIYIDTEHGEEQLDTVFVAQLSAEVIDEFIPRFLDELLILVSREQG